MYRFPVNEDVERAVKVAKEAFQTWKDVACTETSTIFI